MPAQRYTSPSPRSSSKPYTRPSRPSRAKTYIDISDDEAYHENAPALSSPSSNGNDGSSDYDPSLETPLKAMGSKQSLMLTSYDEEDDMKPDFSDDEISYPGIVGDEHVETSEDEGEYGKAGKGKGRGKTAKSTTTPKKPRLSREAQSVEVERNPGWGGRQKKTGSCSNTYIPRSPPIGLALLPMSVETQRQVHVKGIS